MTPTLPYGFNVTAAPTYGDPDLYVSATFAVALRRNDSAWPEFVSATPGSVSESLIIPSAYAWAIPTMWIVITAFSNTSGTLAATWVTADPVMSLTTPTIAPLVSVIDSACAPLPIGYPWGPSSLSATRNASALNSTMTTCVSSDVRWYGTYNNYGNCYSIYDVYGSGFNVTFTVMGTYRDDQPWLMTVKSEEGSTNVCQPYVNAGDRRCVLSWPATYGRAFTIFLQPQCFSMKLPAYTISVRGSGPPIDTISPSAPPLARSDDTRAAVWPAIGGVVAILAAAVVVVLLRRRYHSHKAFVSLESTTMSVTANEVVDISAGDVDVAVESPGAPNTHAVLAADTRPYLLQPPVQRNTTAGNSATAGDGNNIDFATRAVEVDQLRAQTVATVAAVPWNTVDWDNAVVQVRQRINVLESRAYDVTSVDTDDPSDTGTVKISTPNIAATGAAATITDAATWYRVHEPAPSAPAVFQISSETLDAMPQELDPRHESGDQSQADDIARDDEPAEL